MNQNVSDVDRVNRLEDFLRTVLDERDVSIPEIDVTVTLPDAQTAMLFRRVVGRLRKAYGPAAFRAYAVAEWHECHNQPAVPPAVALPIEGWGDEYGDWRGSESLAEHAEAIASRRHNL